MKIVIICLLLLFITPTSIYSQKVGDYYLLSINNIDLPLNDKGILAGVNASSSAKYDNTTFLKSSGFYLSGLSNGLVWSNAVTSYDYARDYLSGTYESGASDPRAQLYRIGSQDIPFGQSWIDWIDAVALGADFYDGNGDEIYNPVDLNNNGQWESNEDRPDLLGDEMLWCVYHDSKPDSERVWNTVNPQGIEIRQTVFAYANSTTYENVIFIRYKILNKGFVSSVFEDSYFGIWANPDIGDSSDDLVGCDTELFGGFAYNDGPDSVYGNNPPSLFIDYLTLPVAYIPGETYLDNDYDNIFNPLFDTPIDTAYSNRGQLFGVKIFPGAKNVPPGLSSSIENLLSDPNLKLPQNIFEARNNLLGLMRLGELADPCVFPYGHVYGIDCSTVAPRRWYSGDPVNTYGWINVVAGDKKNLNSIGPFRLEKNNEVEFFVAYVVGRGTDALNSITTARNEGANASTLYYRNFYIISSIEDDNTPISDYSLMQNYPNPFNPTTTIKYQIPELSFVTLKVYDLLGRVVATLINEEKPAGEYEIGFEGSELTSGIYFYRLQAGRFVETKKMVLLR